ncbi:amidase signature domain-containing protein [Stachybotrys elegans]|uniref:Amidase signature domain-containing protein n=1 Tax=Stachybotrys elegans TaxID=80388 RepID=A0A8K0SBR6_9HYPO|nr:amidase signature domain-containing protein [Stachybotrys elegans]
MDAIIERDSVRYIAFGGFPFGKFELGVDVAAQASLVTVITSDLDTTFNQYLSRMEDSSVYDASHFLDGFIISGLKPTQTVEQGFRQHVSNLGSGWLVLSEDQELAKVLAPGPYLYTNNTLKPICRLYDDKRRAFLTALRPKLDGPSPSTFSQLKAGGTLYDCLAVAVPPRSAERARGTPQRLRIAVKDCYHLKGLKNSLNNLAYYEVGREETSTAAVVTTLAEQGAHILGLTKLSSMIAREEPMDAVDFHTAFNPRGDGYQSPAGSSSGSAAAVASYEWLDCALGTDTSGSGRRPAMVNGVWQFRPSHNLVNLTGMIETYLRFDTPCVFSRDFEHLNTVAKAWLQTGCAASPLSDRRYEIIYPLDYLPVENQSQMKLIDEFVADMSTHLGATVTKLSIKETWKRNPPPGASNDAEEYLKNVITRTFYYGFYHSTDKFRMDYAESHRGSLPYVIPFVRQRWDKGAAVTPEEHQEATYRLEVYKDWLLNILFQTRDAETLLVLPVANAAPNYRDARTGSPTEQSALDQLFLQPILGSPDIVIPIGDVPYDSRISNKVEYLPVVVNIVGAPTTDFQLLQAIKQILELSNRPTSVRTGSRMFEA